MEILRAFPNRSLPLLFSLIADEVRATGTTTAVAVTSNIDPLWLISCVLSTGKVLESTLFRGNDIASHLLSVYCQIVGKTYLVDTLHHLIELVVDTYAKGKSLEGTHFFRNAPINNDNKTINKTPPQSTRSAYSPSRSWRRTSRTWSNCVQSSSAPSPIQSRNARCLCGTQHTLAHTHTRTRARTHTHAASN
jgi:hypothetical protein